MLIRLTVAVCMMMTMLMPCAWADTWEEQVWADAQTENPLAAWEKMQNSPLSKLTAESEEWFEGDTYYIRYTFTNPTDKKVEETVTRTYVDLQAANGILRRTSVVKRDPAPEWTLCIEPHSSMSHTIALPKEPAFTHFIHEAAKFHLASGGTLSYTWDYHVIWDHQDITPPAKIDFHFEPTALNRGILDITVTNQSSEPLSSMYNICVTDLDSTYLSAPIPDSAALDLPPNESKTVHLPYIPLSSEVSYPPHSVYPDFEIDHIKYKYYSWDNSFVSCQRNIFYYPFSYVSNLPLPEVSIIGNMEIIGEYAVYYLTFKNLTDRTQKIDRLFMKSGYETLAYSQKIISLNLSLKEHPIFLRPDKSKHYLLVLPWLTETPQQTLDSFTVFATEPYSLRSADYPTISADRLHPLQKLLYEPFQYAVTDLHHSPWYSKMFQ